MARRTLQPPIRSAYDLAAMTWLTEKESGPGDVLHLYRHIYTCIYVYVYICTCICVSVYVYMCVWGIYILILGYIIPSSSGKNHMEKNVGHDLEFGVI